MAPLATLCSAGAPALDWAPIGLVNMVNPGGALVAAATTNSAAAARAKERRAGSESTGAGATEVPAGAPASASVTCMGPGQFLAYASRPPRAVAVAVATEGNDPETLVRLPAPAPLAPGAFTHDSATGALEVELPATGHHLISVEW